MALTKSNTKIVMKSIITLFLITVFTLNIFHVAFAGSDYCTSNCVELEQTSFLPFDSDSEDNSFNNVEQTNGFYELIYIGSHYFNTSKFSVSPTVNKARAPPPYY